MNKRVVKFIAVIMFTLIASSAYALVYMYKDAKGRWHGVSSMDLVPPQYRNQLQSADGSGVGTISSGGYAGSDKPQQAGQPVAAAKPPAPRTPSTTALPEGVIPPPDGTEESESDARERQRIADEIAGQMGDKFSQVLGKDFPDGYKIQDLEVLRVDVHGKDPDIRALMTMKVTYVNDKRDRRYELWMYTATRGRFNKWLFTETANLPADPGDI
jgi:hypothetical protein